MERLVKPLEKAIDFIYVLISKIFTTLKRKTTLLCYIIHFLIAWAILDMVIDYTNWLAEVIIERILEIKPAKRRLFYGFSHFFFILLPEFIFQMLIVFWYVLQCNKDLFAKYRKVLKIAAMYFLFYWAYISSPWLSKEVRAMMEEHPYQTYFSIVYHAFHTFLFIVALYFWHKFWDK